MTNRVITPFLLEQVAALHVYQFGPWDTPFGRGHPFTCVNRGDGKHFDNGADLGILTPTVRGWECQYCDYTQDWAHDFMANPELLS